SGRLERRPLLEFQLLGSRDFQLPERETSLGVCPGSGRDCSRLLLLLLRRRKGADGRFVCRPVARRSGGCPAATRARQRNPPRDSRLAARGGATPPLFL